MSDQPFFVGLHIVQVSGRDKDEFDKVMMSLQVEAYGVANSHPRTYVGPFNRTWSSGDMEEGEDGEPMGHEPV